MPVSALMMSLFVLVQVMVLPKRPSAGRVTSAVTGSAKDRLARSLLTAALSPMG